MRYFVAYMYTNGDGWGFGNLIAVNFCDPNEDTLKFIEETKEVIKNDTGFTNVTIINYKRAY